MYVYFENNVRKVLKIYSNLNSFFYRFKTKSFSICMYNILTFTYGYKGKNVKQCLPSKTPFRHVWSWSTRKSRFLLFEKLEMGFGNENRPFSCFHVFPKVVALNL